MRRFSIVSALLLAPLPLMVSCEDNADGCAGADCTDLADSVADAGPQSDGGLESTSPDVDSANDSSSDGSDADAGGDAGPIGCCTDEGIGCCATTSGDKCEAEAAACIVKNSIQNGSEICDDLPTTAEPGDNRYYLLCLNDKGGTAYVARNSGICAADAGGAPIDRCQCFGSTMPWDALDYVVKLECKSAGQRIEVPFVGTSKVKVYVGVHARPGTGVHCPPSPGCMTKAAMIAVPR